MQCEEVRDQFTDYLGDSLDEPARAEVHQHLIACESCREEAGTLKSLWTKLGSIPAERPDSTAMRARFDVMLEAYRHGMDHATGATWWGNVNSWIAGFWPSQPAFQLGLTVAVLIVGVIVGRQYSQPTATPLTPGPSQVVEVTQMRDELKDLRQMVALSLMQQQSASERLKGVSWSNEIDQPDTQFLNALLDTLMHDANVNVRLAAVDALKKFGERQIVKTGVLQALAQQDSPMVQGALINYMVETQNRESVDTLRQISLSTDTNETVRKRAEWGLEQLK
jgi:hypothetical protein